MEFGHSFSVWLFYGHSYSFVCFLGGNDIDLKTVCQRPDLFVAGSNYRKIVHHLNLKANVKNYFLKSRFSGFTTCLSHYCAQFGLCCLQGRLNPRSQSTLNSCFSLSLAEPRSKPSCESGLAGQLIYNLVRICLSANMISVPFCNPPTDHDFPRKWFKLLGRDRKRREHS